LRIFRIAVARGLCYHRAMTPQKSIPPGAWADILLLSLLWGASFLSISVALREVPVFTTVAFRVGVAAVLLWGYVWLRRIPVPRGGRIWLGMAGMGVLNNAIPFTLIVWGQQHIASGLASILNASTAIFGVVVAALFLADERLTRRKIAGVGLGFLGVITAIGPAALTYLSLTSLSQLALVGAAISYAFSGVWARKMMTGASPQLAAAGMTTFSTLIMVPVALWHDGVPNLSHSATTWAALAYLSVAATAMAYMLYYRVLEKAGSGNLMVVTLMVAPVAILLGALVLGEALPHRAYAGFALLVAGLLVLDGRALRLVQGRV